MNQRHPENKLTLKCRRQPIPTINPVAKECPSGSHTWWDESSIIMEAFISGWEQSVSCPIKQFRRLFNERYIASR